MKREPKKLINQGETEKEARRRFTTGRKGKPIKLKKQTIVLVSMITESNVITQERRRRARIPNSTSLTTWLRTYWKVELEGRRQEKNHEILTTDVSSNKPVRKGGVILTTRAKRFLETTELIWE